jgi:hypothetical protein
MEAQTTENKSFLDTIQYPTLCNKTTVLDSNTKMHCDYIIACSQAPTKTRLERRRNHANDHKRSMFILDVDPSLFFF